MFKRLIRKIRKLIYWLPVIWNDRDFDQYYIYEILRHKLISMRNFFENNAHTLYSKERAKEMDLCIKILNRLIADEYHINAHYFHDKKWGKLEIDFIPYNDKYDEMISNRENIKSEKDKDQELKEFLKCCHHEDYLRRQDIEYLCKILSKKIFTWWVTDQKKKIIC